MLSPVSQGAAEFRYKSRGETSRDLAVRRVVPLSELKPCRTL